MDQNHQATCPGITDSKYVHCRAFSKPALNGMNSARITPTVIMNAPIMESNLNCAFDGRFIYFAERPRSPMAARGAIRAGRGTSSRTERDADSHSVDRIVRVYLFMIAVERSVTINFNSSGSFEIESACVSTIQSRSFEMSAPHSMLRRTIPRHAAYSRS